jgi:succinate dehydrogenase hydrophobic anchor subunit
MPEMDDSLSHDRQRKSFFWGTALTGILSIPLIIVFLNAFRAISAERATGLAAVAGGLAEAYVTLGVLLSLALPVAAIVLLLRSFSAGHRMRGLISLLCICASALTLALAGLFVWGVFVYLPHTPGAR